MSIVVAVTKNGRTVVASDSMGFYGYQRVPTDNSKAVKVRRAGAALVAMTGWSIYENILEDLLSHDPEPSLGNCRDIFTFFTSMWKELHQRYPFVNDQVDSKDSPFGDLGATFMVVSRQGIFKVASDTNVARFEKYCAIGSGGDYALGALYAAYDRDDEPLSLARLAVETAINYDTHCGGEVEVYDVPSEAPAARRRDKATAAAQGRRGSAARRRKPRGPKRRAAATSRVRGGRA
jgi:ATP-dependent protease HslVU (ClpYQ) peptidase subunit